MIIWKALSEQERSQVLQRPIMDNAVSIKDAVTSIINDVKQQGDSALLRLAKQFDGVELSELRLSETLKKKALDKLCSKRKAAIELAYSNIKTFHQAQLPADLKITTSPGVECRLLNQAINTVGLYIPGGSAPLPSTVLMLGVPAQIAGCNKVVLCTPPDISADNYGGVTPEIAYAAELCGIDEIYLSGGAQAVAAMAYGTQSIAKVDKIFGPGNGFVTEAKQQVSLDPLGAAIDMPAGPSEVLVLADESANPVFIAADLLSQAEHGPDSQVILLCNDKMLLTKTQEEVQRQLVQLPRADIAQRALETSRFILTESVTQSVEICNQYAPEHLIVQTNDPEALLPEFSSAASIFLGAYTPESAGDYASGTNHVLPTYGYAKVLSALSLSDFIRTYTVQSVSKQGIQAIGPAIMTLAEAEGLDAHRNAVAVRLAQLEQEQNQENSNV